MTRCKLLLATAFSAVWINVAAAQGPDAGSLPSLPPPVDGLTVLEAAADDKKPEPLPEPGKVEPAKEAAKDAAPAVVHVETGDCSTCDKPAKCGKFKCHIDWLRPWTCEDLEMKPFEPGPQYCGCKKFFHCPKKEGEKNGTGEGERGAGSPLPKDEKNTGDGVKKEGEEATKEEEKKNGNGEEKKEEEKKDEGPTTPLMQLINCWSPCKYDRMQKRGDNFYGWVEAGYTFNTGSPNDRINFGTNFNWRSNDYQLSQVYFVYENALEHDGKPNVGYRLDFYGGQQTPFQVANGLFSNFTGFDVTSGYGVEGPPSFRQLNRYGIDLPQFYINAQIPNFITEKGIDILIGKFWTLLGHETYPAPTMEFYSMSYEIIYATPFTHTGILTTLHATDTLSVTAGVIRGNDVFEDNNQRPSWIGNFVWNSCDKRYNWTTAWVTGPEQFNNNDNYRTVITSYLTALFGECNQWRAVVGGNMSWEANAAAAGVDAAGNPLFNDAEWYGVAGYLFYTVNPKLILGSRVEWWRDDDGVRTAVTKRPGFAANFYEATFGFTYKPYKNVRVRPEVRFDYANGPAVDGSGARPYNDLLDSFQTTIAFDIIWEF
jgi:hypothetical protein